MVVEEQAYADHPGRPDAAIMRQDETQGPDDMRGDRLQTFALHQGFANQAKIVLFEIAQAAMDELARS